MLEIQAKAYRECASLDVRRRCKLYVYLRRGDDLSLVMSLWANAECHLAVMLCVGLVAEAYI